MVGRKCGNIIGLGGASPCINCFETKQSRFSYGLSLPSGQLERAETHRGCLFTSLLPSFASLTRISAPPLDPDSTLCAPAQNRTSRP